MAISIISLSTIHAMIGERTIMKYIYAMVYILCQALHSRDPSAWGNLYRSILCNKKKDDHQMSQKPKGRYA